jgi:RNA polymerase sigma-70 factor (ECF subfamily)
MGMDTNLVVRSQRGDEGAFRDLTLAIGPRLLGVAFGVLRDRSLAEDATQRTLLQVWQKLPRLRDPAKFEGWCYRILVRACWAEAKKQRRWISGEVVGSHHEPVAPDAYGVVAERDQLESGFRRLSVDQRAVIVLHHYLGLTIDETAEALDIPVGTARSRLYRAVQSMRSALEADARPAHSAALPTEVTR